MREEYHVFLGDKSVGTVQVQKEGLYYRIACRCHLSGEVLYRVLVRCGNQEESLGVLVPVDGLFGLTTKIPVKRIGEGELSFRAIPRHMDLKDHFIPLAPEEPFHYISRLKDSYLEKRNKQIGIIIREPDGTSAGPGCT